LKNTNAFTNTAIAAGVGGIYVPSSLLSSYKTASNWSTYADNIYPFDAYPVTNFETITDSWEQIIDSIDKGTYNTKYNVGDTKKININNEEVYAQIVAFDRDVLEDGITTVPITFITKNITSLIAKMNSSVTTNGGWAECDLRQKLNNEEGSGIILTIDSNIASRIKAVKKTYTATTDSSSTASVVDKLWIPSTREIFGGSSYENSGTDYTDFFNTSKKRSKYRNFTSSTWFLRSVYSTTSWRAVDNNGSLGSLHVANSGAYYVLGFCLG